MNLVIFFSNLRIKYNPRKITPSLRTRAFDRLKETRMLASISYILPNKECRHNFYSTNCLKKTLMDARVQQNILYQYDKYEALKHY